MADRNVVFPDPGAQPGDYGLEWQVARTRRFAGDVTLAARRWPRLSLYGKLRRSGKREAGTVTYAIPGPTVEFPRLVGRLRSNEEVVVIDASLTEWFPGRYQGYARWAIVGLDIAAVPDDRYSRVRFQISDADLWGGTPPLERLNLPVPKNKARTYSATLNRAAHRVWRDTRNGIVVDFGYDHTFRLDQYRFGLRFAPVFDISSRDPLTLDEWRDHWVAPFVDLASVATKRPQTLSWLRVQHGEGRSSRGGAVFSGGIHQEPYEARYDDEWRRDEASRPLFTLGRLPVSPMRLVREWRRLQATSDPFVELYRAALFQPELPPRARFLQLVQALEARHRAVNRKTDERAQAGFRRQRQAVIQAVRDAGVSPARVRFLRDEWGSRRLDSLEGRLAAILDELPPRVRARIEQDPGLETIRALLVTENPNAASMQAQLRILRNQLSHGGRNYPDSGLRPWVTALETICQAQILGLLGFRSGDIETALGSS